MKIKELNIAEDELKRLLSFYEDLSEDTEIEYDRHISRQTGTGYKNYIYKIVGTPDALVIQRNIYQSFTGSFRDEAIVESDYYLKRENYGRECAKLSKKYDLPWEICSILGINEKIYPRFKEKLEQLNLDQVYDYEAYENHAGITRRNDEIQNLFPEPEFSHISNKGQGQSSTMFYFLFEQIFKNENIIQQQLENTKSYKKIMNRYDFLPNVAYAFLRDLQGEFDFLSLTEQEQSELVSKEYDRLKSNVKNHHIVSDPEKNIFLNQLQEKVKNGERINEKYLIYKLDNYFAEINEPMVNALKTSILKNAIESKDIYALRNLLAIDTYTENGAKYIPKVIIENLINVLQPEIHKNENIDLSRIDYGYIMSICAPIHHLNIPDEQKEALQILALQAIPEDKYEPSIVHIFKDKSYGNEKYVEHSSKLNELRRIFEGPDLEDDKIDKLYEFLTKEFKNDKLYYDYKSASELMIGVASEMRGYVDENFRGIVRDEVAESDRIAVLHVLYEDNPEMLYEKHPELKENGKLETNEPELDEL